MTTRTIRITDPQSPHPNPVNSLGANTRIHLLSSLRYALDDPTVTSIILIGGGGGAKGKGGKNFSAGADINEFSNPSSVTSDPNDPNGSNVPSLVELCHAIETSPKPVVAAIRGVALGGGLELALSCHYRIADNPNGAAASGGGKGTPRSKTRLGLPEVNIGLIPGAGGTQRLPRLTGVKWALGAITTGRMVGVEEALKVGLIDGIAGQGVHLVGGKQILVPADESLEECAERWAEYAEIMPTVGRMVSLKPVFGQLDELAKLCDAAAAKLPKPDRGGEAVHAAIKAVRASFERANFEQGMETEAELFMELLLNSTQGRARRHAFFAERRAQSSSSSRGGKGKAAASAKAAISAMVSSPQTVPIGIIGAGTMGSGIALTFLRAGYTPVILIDTSSESLNRGVALIKKLIQKDVAKKRITPQMAESMVKALRPSTDLAALKDCKLIVEAAFENLDVKKSIFAKLDAVAKQDAYLVSNTSTLDIDAIASTLSPRRRGKCAGMHFFSPAHVMKLVEIVTGEQTSEETIGVIQGVTRKINKVGVTVGNCDGFVGNRMLHPYTSEMLFVIESGGSGGSTIPNVDAALTKFGMAIGPFVMSDLAGNDIGYNIRREKGLVRDVETGSVGRNRVEGMRYTELGDDLVVKLGRVGQKAGKGWYTYDQRVGGGRVPLPSSEVAALVSTYAANLPPSHPDKAGRRRPLAKDEIVERLLYPLVNEGFKILEEGIARDSSDIDVIYLYGYGWPVWRGGPMFWADHEVGLPKLLARLEEFHGRYPGSDYYAPSGLLRECVAMDVGVQEYYRKGFHNKEKSGGGSLSKL